MTLSPVEIASVSAAVIAAGAAVWQGVLTRLAIRSSADVALAQERLTRLIEVYTALQTLKFSALRAQRAGEEASDELLDTVISAVYRVSETSTHYVMAEKSGKFTKLYSEISDFYVWFFSQMPLPEDKSPLKHIEDCAKDLSNKVFVYSLEQGQSGK